jgi:hypothetical protein
VAECAAGFILRFALSLPCRRSRWTFDCSSAPGNDLTPIDRMELFGAACYRSTIEMNADPFVFHPGDVALSLNMVAFHQQGEGILNSHRIRDLQTCSRIRPRQVLPDARQLSRPNPAYSGLCPTSAFPHRTRRPRTNSGSCGPFSNPHILRV